MIWMELKKFTLDYKLEKILDFQIILKASIFVQAIIVELQK
jgi:hypothetical protein